MSDTCQFCDNQTEQFATATILDKHQVRYFRCQGCGFVKTEEAHWLEEAYSDSIVLHDTGGLARSMELSKVVLMAIAACRLKAPKCLDYGGGWGILTRRMRDLGVNFFCHDPFTENLVAHGFSADLDQRYDMITACEVVEHFSNPGESFDSILSQTKNFLFTTSIVPEPTPMPEDWHYYALNSGQHISFYTVEALQKIAAKYGLNLYSDGFQYHLMTNKKLPAFTMKWISFLAKIRMQHFVKPWLKPKTETDSVLLAKKQDAV